MQLSSIQFTAPFCLFPFFFSQKLSEKQIFLRVFRGNKNGTLVRESLIVEILFYGKKCFFYELCQVLCSIWCHLYSLKNVKIPWRSVRVSTPLSAEWDNFQSQILKRERSKKVSAWGNFHRYLPGGLLCFLSKKTFKINYGSEGSIQNVGLGQFQTNNQLMFSFVTFWLC